MRNSIRKNTSPFFCITRACAEALQRFHGYLYQKQGDGIIAYFGYPTAAEDAAERAIRAGLMIIDVLSQRPVSDVGFLKARVGVSTGLVVISDPIRETYPPSATR